MARRQAAVVVERACKNYGKLEQPVLDNLNMTVERGIIYGLLGPSGCGKTTLLSCIVGRRKLDSGNVWVLGGTPGEKGSGVPGPRVGYMPQDIALVAEFSVRDAIYYFGRIYGMSAKLMRERFEFLRNLLELPSGRRLIKTLSGGQQRRVSLAAALVHEPELLILDEPTVGLDPVLRERIWEFLSNLARNGTTVIITTHYIDETKQAHKIGLLRDGQLLAEDSPEEILRQFQCDTLEEAFLKLAQRQEIQSARRPALSASPDVIPENSMVNNADSRYHSQETFNVVTSSTDVLTKDESPKDCKDNSRGRYKAVLIKSTVQFSRHPGGLIFSILFPIIQVVAFFSAIGRDPYDLKVAVVNEEAAFSPLGLDICRNTSIQYTTLLDDEDETCELFMMSCWFIEELEKKSLFQVPYNNTLEAQRAVFDGKYYGALYFTRNFSSALGTRIRSGLVEDDDILSNGTVHVWLDMTDHQISLFLKNQIVKAYQSFTKRAMRGCNRQEHVAQVPINFMEPIYGENDPQFVEYMAPGVMITIIFFLATVVTSTLMISDRLEGVWERSAVAGVKAHEMLHVHIMMQAVIILVQTAEMMLLAFALYGLPSKGSLTACAILLFIQGLGGMCYGFLLSVVCTSFTMSFFIATGSFYPMILLCGILWPLEAMPSGLRVVSYLLPFTYPIASLRDLMQKGTPFTDHSVYIGYIVTFAWIALTLSLCFVRLRFRKT